MRVSLRISRILVVAAGVVTAATGSAMAAYIQTNLVSDIPGFAAITDAALVNPWGLSHSPTSPFWISDQGTQLSTLYSVGASLSVTKSALVVGIPQTAAGPQGPTGQVFANVPGNFLLPNGPATFIFADLNGTISAWNAGQGTSAVIVVTTVGAVYTGLAISNDAGVSRLYAANGAQNRVDVFDTAFARLNAPVAFIDPNLPAGLVPFNVQAIGGKIYVTYAPPGRVAQTSATEGQGVVAVFDPSGAFLQQLVTGSRLAAPWGVALAPAGFGAFGGDLLVGNFSFVASEINAFDPATGAYAGTIPIATGTNGPGGLWALDFGTGGNNGSPNTLFFTDAINGERDGLFAAITPVPEPGSLALIGASLTSVLVGRLRRRRSGM